MGLDVIDEIQIENLIVEVKGIEKLDTQWVITQNPSPGEKQRRGKTCIWVLFILTLSFFMSDILLDWHSMQYFLVGSKICHSMTRRRVWRSIYITLSRSRVMILYLMFAALISKSEYSLKFLQRVCSLSLREPWD